MLLFPYEHVRPSQEDFMRHVKQAIREKTNLIIHAPTGMGKSAAVLAPALTEGLDNDLTIFFLTSRHTQHEIAIKTLEEIRDKHGKDISAVDIIGKKWMCLQPGVENLPSGEFTEFCRALREDGKCDYYSNLKKGEALSMQGELATKELSMKNPVKTRTIIETCTHHNICPYYTSMELAKSARVIIGDYYYIFHKKIREQFMTRTGHELEKSIIIVDEAHNLPERIKHLASAQLSSVIIKRAITEADKHQLTEISNRLKTVLDIYDGYAHTMDKEERRVSREDFREKVSRLGDYDALTEELLDTGDRIREKAQVSYIGAVGSFLESWQGGEEGYTRILSRRKRQNETIITLSYRCLDPSLISAPVIEVTHSTILMSGTLTPTMMYQAVLGITKSTNLTYPSPFPNKNRLNLIIPQTSTKYTTRSDEMYKSISEVLRKVISKIPGNVAVFFPSYYLLEEVRKTFETATAKTVFCEQQAMTTTEKQEFIDRFRSYKNTGAVLLGVISGNFGEGIDLPGDELQGVIIVGLPLNKPDLETESLIHYCDEKFGKGWDYGYLFPAFNKTLQSAGRCIRSETDRGVIVFLDERYAWPNYKRCFPEDFEVKISLLYEDMVEEFFKGKAYKTQA